MQLKCTSQDVLHGSEITFSLPVKNYNELVPANLMVPRILIVVLVPENIDEWITLSEDQLILRRCIYWISLRDRPTSNNEKTVDIHIPREKILSPNELKQIMNRIASGGLP